MKSTIVFYQALFVHNQKLMKTMQRSQEEKELWTSNKKHFFHRLFKRLSIVRNFLRANSGPLVRDFTKIILGTANQLVYWILPKEISVKFSFHGRMYVLRRKWTTQKLHLKKNSLCKKSINIKSFTNIPTPGLDIKIIKKCLVKVY